MRRTLFIVLLIIGSMTTAYIAWAWHRISARTLVRDREWPRPAPYPDDVLLALNDWFDARNPARPGGVKIEGEVEAVRLTLIATMVISVGVTLCGALPLAWPWVRRMRRSRGFEVSPTRQSSEGDSLTDELMTSNPEFQALLAKSKASPRQPFTPRRG